MAKAAKLYMIEGEKGKHGSLFTKRVHIECSACGNTERFYGTAYTNPMIVIEQQGHASYDVVEISYKSDGQVDEVVERCGKCSATRDKLIFTPLN